MATLIHLQIEGANGWQEFADAIAVKHPQQAPDGNAIAQHLGQPGRHFAGAKASGLIRSSDLRALRVHDSVAGRNSHRGVPLQALAGASCRFCAGYLVLGAFAAGRPPTRA